MLGPDKLPQNRAHHRDHTQNIKHETSLWAKKRTPLWNGFYWQAGYGIFSVSQSLVPQVDEYIGNQETHHRGIDYKDEFRLFCRKHELPIDERYVGD